MDAAGEWRLYLLGGFRLTRGETPVRLSTRKAASLLAFLVLHPGRHSREHLATLFWGDSPDVEARRSLRTALSHLRSLLGAHWVIADKDVVQLSPSFAVAVDALAFQAAAERSLAGVGPPEVAFLDLYQGDFLPGFDDEWVLPVRERLHSLYVDVLLHLTQQTRASSDYAQAIDLARRALAVEPSNERAHQHLMFCYMMSGDRSAALQQYDACRRALREDLGIAPLPETMALYAWIKGRPEHATGYAARITNLPAPLTSLVGRTGDLAAGAAVLRRPEVRLLTLTGAGGSGKTRLALQLGALLLDEFSHGVFFVDLSSLRQPDLLLTAIAATLGVQLSGPQPLGEALADYLRQKTMLLVLDNFEQIVSAAPQLLPLLEAAPGLKLLVTSRVALRIAPEHEYVVSPLSVPDPQHLPDWAALPQYEAVTLFIERSLAVRPDFRVTSANAAAVAEICARLDGLPLAIELAAARSNVLTPQAMLPRLSHRLGLLTSSRRDVPARHETLRKAIDWSYALLSREQQRLFRWLAVFAGGWTLEAAEAVCRDALHSPNLGGAGTVLDELGVLVDSHLVRRVAEAGGGLRFGMLETVREYALEQLEESGDAEVMRAAHAQYFLALAQDVEPKVCGPEQKSWLEYMEAEQNNLRAVLQWAIDSGDAETGLRLAKALWEFWRRLDQDREALRWCTALLALPQAQAPSVLRAYALSSAALATAALGKAEQAVLLGAEAVSLSRSLGDTPSLARALWVQAAYAGREPAAVRKTMLSESLALYRQTGNAMGTVRALRELAFVIFSQDANPPAALSLYQEALNLARPSGDARLKIFILMGMVDSLSLSGHQDQARSLLEEARILNEQIGNSVYQAALLFQLGYLAASQTDALRLSLEAVTILRDLGHRTVLAMHSSLIAESYASLGELETAESYLQQALALSKEIGDRSAEDLAYCEFGRLAALRGDNDGVLRAERQALGLHAQGFGYPWWCALSVEDLAHRAVAVGDWPRAARLLGAITVFITTTGYSSVPRGRLEKSVAALREHMSDPAVAAAWAEGQAMTIEQAGLRELKEIEEAGA